MLNAISELLIPNMVSSERDTQQSLVVASNLISMCGFNTGCSCHAILPWGTGKILLWQPGVYGKVSQVIIVTDPPTPPT